MSNPADVGVSRDDDRMFFGKPLDVDSLGTLLRASRDASLQEPEVLNSSQPEPVYVHDP